LTSHWPPLWSCATPADSIIILALFACWVDTYRNAAPSRRLSAFPSGVQQTHESRGVHVEPTETYGYATTRRDCLLTSSSTCAACLGSGTPCLRPQKAFGEKKLAGQAGAYHKHESLLQRSSGWPSPKYWAAAAAEHTHLHRAACGPSWSSWLAFFTAVFSVWVTSVFVD
jgi:hypothetical protein